MVNDLLTRRHFIAAAAAGSTAVTASPRSPLPALPASSNSTEPRTQPLPAITGKAFAAEVERVLPPEEIFDYHKRLTTGPVHIARRGAGIQPLAGEMAFSEQGWKLAWNRHSTQVLHNAVQDFQNYMRTSMRVTVQADERDSLENWQALGQSIVVGTRAHLKGCGAALKRPKDYEIVVKPEQITVCGFDERGAMYGLYNLEARMNLREAPFLPKALRTVRHSLYDTRMVLSWMGWMEWPDTLFSHLSHDGFDAILACVYANPNGDRTTAETSTDWYARGLYRIRKQDPARTRDLIDRAARYGIKVYTQIIYQYTGTPDSEAGLRKLVRDIVKEFPDIQGYVLLTEGFWYKQWGGGHGPDDVVKEWARNWAQAVGIVTEECHRVNPSIEVLPWDYNIGNRRDKADLKRYVIQQLPSATIPLLTWENGKSFMIDGFEGKLNDYSISQVGPAEVVHVQIQEARTRGMKVYVNADTFVCGGQFQTLPYHPFPFQWYERYKALETYGVNGTLESWTSGYTPNFMTELRSWYCWSDAPPLEELLGGIASRIFGKDGREIAVRAWDFFSQAIRLVPDTGPTMGTSNAIGNPLFFQEPLPVRAASFKYSWSDQASHPWPYTLARLTFYPDFTNKTNAAENYARRVAGIQASKDQHVLPVFLQHLRQAADIMEKGLALYRSAALTSPDSKRPEAVREVVIAEQVQRMMQSLCAILEFEDMRMQLAAEKDRQKAKLLLGKMEGVVREEIARTELSRIAATRDSRFGFQQECDYVYTSYSLREKLEVLQETLNKQLPSARDGL